MNKYVLWLTSWYPGRVQATNGDFVERHAQAVNAFVPIIILLVEKDDSMLRGETEVDRSFENGFTVYRGYYGRTSRFSIIEKIASLLIFRRLQKQIYNDIVRTHGKPSLIHVHVAMKAGLLALDLLRKYKIPFVLTEHWTGYYPESIPSYDSLDHLSKRFTRKIFIRASIVFPVSDNLGKRIQDIFGDINCKVISNVVDTKKFNLAQTAPPIFRFIHPSYLNYQKNPEGMIEAAAILARQDYHFELYFIGNSNAHLEEKATKLGLLNRVIFIKPSVSYEEVANQMKVSSALLLFSRFENLPCVLLEALCCGLPVISSRVGGINEIVNETNGILVSSENVQELATAMKHMMENYSGYNRTRISEEAIGIFNYPAIGGLYYDWYKKITNDLVASG